MTIYSTSIKRTISLAKSLKNQYNFFCFNCPWLMISHIKIFFLTVREPGRVSKLRIGNNNCECYCFE